MEVIIAEVEKTSTMESEKRYLLSYTRVNSRYNEFRKEMKKSFVLWRVYNLEIYNPAGKIAEKAVRMSAFWIIWRGILNADSTKTHSSSVTF